MVESFDKCYLISRAGELLNVTCRTGALEGKGGGGGGCYDIRARRIAYGLILLNYTNSSPYP